MADGNLKPAYTLFYINSVTVGWALAACAMIYILEIRDFCDSLMATVCYNIVFMAAHALITVNIMSRSNESNNFIILAWAVAACAIIYTFVDPIMASVYYMLVFTSATGLITVNIMSYADERVIPAKKVGAGARVQGNWRKLVISGTVTAVHLDGKVTVKWDNGNTAASRTVGTGHWDVQLI